MATGVTGVIFLPAAVNLKLAMGLKQEIEYATILC